MPHPLKAVVDIRREEMPRALLLFGCFFLIITTFWILKPIKKALFITHYHQSGFEWMGATMTAASTELLAKALNVVVALAATAVFSLLSRRHRRQHLLARIGGFFVVAFALYAQVISEASTATVWSFYLLGDLFSTLMVAGFFVLLSDSVDADGAKRTYGPICLGGVTGGLFGSMIVSGFISDVSASTWLWICVGLSIATIAAVLATGRLAPTARGLGATRDDPGTTGEHSTALSVRDSLGGARLVLRSRYLQAILVIVVSYEMVSTVMDFQFSATIAAYCAESEIQQRFATAFLLMNCVAFVVQLALTSVVMRRLGLRVALLALPCATLVGSGAFMAMPVLWVGTLIPSLDGGLAVSINQSAKESLYVPTGQDAKYRAKAFIDMFVQRGAKLVAICLLLLIGGSGADFAGVRYLSLLSFGLIALWVVAAYYVGGQFDAISSRQAAPPRAASGLFADAPAPRNGAGPPSPRPLEKVLNSF